MARSKFKSSEPLARPIDGEESSPPLKRMRTRSQAKASALAVEEGSYASLDSNRARDALCERLGLHYPQAETCMSSATSSLSTCLIPESSSTCTLAVDMQRGQTKERTSEQASSSVVTEPTREVCSTSTNALESEIHKQLSVSAVTSESRQIDTSQSAGSTDQCTTASEAQQLVPEVAPVAASTVEQGSTDFRNGQELPSLAHFVRANVPGLRDHPTALSSRDRTSHLSNPSSSPSTSNSFSATSNSHQISMPSPNHFSPNPPREMARHYQSWGASAQHHPGNMPVPQSANNLSNPLSSPSTSNSLSATSNSHQMSMPSPNHFSPNPPREMARHHQPWGVSAQHHPGNMPVPQPANIVYSATINPAQERQLGAGSFVNTEYPHVHQQHNINLNVGAAQSAMGIPRLQRPPPSTEQQLAYLKNKYNKLEAQCNGYRQEINVYKPFYENWHSIDARFGIPRITHMKQRYDSYANAATYYRDHSKELETKIGQLHAENIAMQEEINRLRVERQNNFESTYFKLNAQFAQAFDEQSLEINALRAQLGKQLPLGGGQYAMEGTIVIPDDEDEPGNNVLRNEEATREDVMTDIGPDVEETNGGTPLFEGEEQENDELNGLFEDEQEKDELNGLFEDEERPEEEPSSEDVDEFARQLMEGQDESSAATDEDNGMTDSEDDEACLEGTPDTSIDDFGAVMADSWQTTNASDEVAKECHEPMEVEDEDGEESDEECRKIEEESEESEEE